MRSWKYFISVKTLFIQYIKPTVISDQFARPCAKSYINTFCDQASSAKFLLDEHFIALHTHWECQPPFKSHVSCTHLYCRTFTVVFIA